MSLEILNLWLLLFILGLAILFWVGAEVRELRKFLESKLEKTQNPKDERG